MTVLPSSLHQLTQLEQRHALKLHARRFDDAGCAPMHTRWYTIPESPYNGRFTIGKRRGAMPQLYYFLRFQHDASTSLEIDGITKLQPFIFICFTLNHCQSVMSDHHHWWLPCLSSARLTHLRLDIAATAALNTELLGATDQEQVVENPRADQTSEAGSAP